MALLDGNNHAFTKTVCFVKNSGNREIGDTQTFKAQAITTNIRIFSLWGYKKVYFLWLS